MENSNLPKDFEESMRARLGKSYTEFYDSLTKPSPVSLRLNPKKTVTIEGDAVPWCEFGKYLKERPVFTLDPVFHAGAYYVQEASSMFLEQAIKQTIDQSKPLRALDLCAAPGGKSTHVLSLLHPESILVSNEVIRSRASILSENVQKWGYNNVVVTNNDPEDFSSLQGFFDMIIVDAPCSGEGLFRKDAEAMNEWSPATVDLCSKRQRRILADVWPALKPNGLLVYCTCTYNEKENEENLRWLSNYHSVESVTLSIEPTWGTEHVQVNKMHGYRFYPHKVVGEGFFLSVVRKVEPQNEFRLKPKKVLTIASKKISEQLKTWITSDDKLFFEWNHAIHMIPASKADEIEFLIQHLKIVHAGTTLVNAKHDKLIPEHSSALSIELQIKNFELIEVSLEEALNYLKKESVQLPTHHIPRGFALITHKQIPLGWVNVLDNRINNLYPKEWRIRMR
jgi:16S rRNA C967 or C1407 C5-methylase (RsmB/RsmF family)/NOL1/NOP2/fmu family ribosome biogenesis protein